MGAGPWEPLGWAACLEPPTPLLQADVRSQKEEPRAGASWRLEGRAPGSPRRALRSDGAGLDTWCFVPSPAACHLIGLLELNWEGRQPQLQGS